MNLLPYTVGLLGLALAASISPAYIRRWLLLLASLGFYANLDWRFLVVMLVVVGITYVGALIVERDRSRAGLAGVFVVLILVPLLVYKYVPVWFAGLENYLPVSKLDFGGYGDVFVPAGLSFYTFQCLGYLIDVYRAAHPADRNFLRFTLFISFFPQLLAGPIERYQILAAPLWDGKRPTPDMVMNGLLLIAYGLFLKSAIGDRLGSIVDPAFEAAGSGGWQGALIGFFGFLFQLLADFGGYSLIAVGAGYLFGVTLINNFKQPLFSENLTDFWQRWHISLTRWIGDYIYRPVGRFMVRNTTWSRNAKENVTAYITWTTIGLWHGASATFLMFGILQASLIVGQKSLPRWIAKPADGWLRGIKTMITFLIVGITFGLVRANTFDQYLDMLKALVTFTPGPGTLSAGTAVWPAIAVMVLVEAIARYRPQTAPRGPWPKAACIFVLVVAAILLGDEDGRNFIYFRF